MILKLKNIKFIITSFIFLIDDVDINDILISNKIFYKKSHKYFNSFKDDEKLIIKAIVCNASKNE